jgi:hypothetical protein
MVPASRIANQFLVGSSSNFSHLAPHETEFLIVGWIWSFFLGLHPDFKWHSNRTLTHLASPPFILASWRLSFPSFIRWLSPHLPPATLSPKTPVFCTHLIDSKKAIIPFKNCFLNLLLRLLHLPYAFKVVGKTRINHLFTKTILVLFDSEVPANI